MIGSLYRCFGGSCKALRRPSTALTDGGGHLGHKPFAAVPQLPPALRLPQKNTPLDFGSMYFVDFIDNLSIPKPFLSVSQLPQALFLRPQRTDNPCCYHHGGLTD